MRRFVLSAGISAAAVAAFAVPASADGTTPADITWVTANSDSTGDQDNAAVATARTGYTAVVWEDDRDATNPADPVHSDVWVRLYLNGASQYEKKLSAGGTGNWRHAQPDVALHEDGSAVVVWAEDPDANGFYNIAVRALNTAGTVTGSASANASADGQQLNPAVAADPDGAGFAVAFEDEQGTAAPTVRVSGFASISSKTYETQVNAAGGTHQRPDVAMGAAGNAIVVWDEDGDANGAFNVARKAFTPSGGVKLAQALVNVTTAGQQRYPSIAANFNGDYAVAWESDTQIGARSFSATGTAASPVDSIMPGDDPQVGIDDQRNVVVNWSSGDDIHAQGLNADGTTTGRLPRLRVHTVIAGRQDEPALAVSPWGQITLVYTDDNDGNSFDQVYLGTGLINSTW
ncbi:hypothetical protein V5P93_004460 [Actinokineospora auranticolor]|uniref:Uncharacterized protein n=1 Tax=Actinokineospora auranticolor TaxID=155976 RepID=A0A2S6GT61_9PSEU|nr:hypothetical protein [Actinokineospora auranticolor]PPK68432.1 hypothetical protein CLV40_105155 [Actinokineospora auranticolor]